MRKDKRKETGAARVFPLEGMHCAACAARAERALRKLEGVEEAAVNFASAEASVRFDPAAVSPQDMQAALRRLGFTLHVADDAPPSDGEADRFARLRRRTADRKSVV